MSQAKLTMADSRVSGWNTLTRFHPAAAPDRPAPRRDPAITALLHRHRTIMEDLAALNDAIQRVVATAPIPTEAPAFEDTRSAAVAALRQRGAPRRSTRRRWTALTLAAAAAGAIAALVMHGGSPEGTVQAVAVPDPVVVAETPVGTVIDSVAPVAPRALDVAAPTPITTPPATATSASVATAPPEATALVAGATSTARTARTTPTDTITIRVQPEDAVEWLAEVYQTTPTEIVRLNRLVDPALILIGQELRISGGFDMR